MSIITIDQSKNEFAWKIDAKIEHTKWISWKTTAATFKIKYANLDWIEVARVNIRVNK
ncbi:hypothetical protein [Mesoplasma melaleucae]|uniref:Uncharacterized protein n=1 Tax=Mesoplasma melaleucae TaxID=81459 RepID=A0A2K8NXD7_9MOLU|nr:hypothetical protein [Mesoplasma melaleucae]ATZ18206.1 hypothetical protein EMELA_v1c07050 [Mesoplasma melaleucae]